jgi:hypothetical protein
LPDGIFTYQKSHFWYILRGHALESFEMAVWYIFGVSQKVKVHLFSCSELITYLFFGGSKKSGNPAGHRGGCTYKATMTIFSSKR